MNDILTKNINIFNDVEDVSLAVAKEFIRLAKESIILNGRFSVVLAGGTTPLNTYKILADSMKSELDWNKVFFFFGDERFVSKESIDSNYFMIKSVLFDKIQIPTQNVFSFNCDNLSVEDSVLDYKKKITSVFGNVLPKFDLVLLGMGQDGHTASIFPSSKTIFSKDIIEIERNSPKPPSIRITMTYELINNAKNILIMVSGQDKANTLNKVLNNKKDIVNLPIQGIEPTSGNLNWYITKNALI